MNYINCPSYSSIFFALHLQNIGEEIIVITINKNVKKFCDFSQIESILLTLPTLGFKNLYQVVDFKKQIDLILNKIPVIHSDKYYLLDNSFTIEGFYIAKEWSKKIKL